MRFSLYNCGQVCCAVERVYVEMSIKNSFEDKCLDKIKAWNAGDGMDPASQLGPLVSQTQRELVLTHVTDAIKSGAKLLYGGAPVDGPGNFFQPTLLRCGCRSMMTCIFKSISLFGI